MFVGIDKYTQIIAADYYLGRVSEIVFNQISLVKVPGDHTIIYVLLKQHSAETYFLWITKRVERVIVARNVA